MNPSTQPTIFSTLPMEVMACIVNELDLQSIARFSISCKEMNVATARGLQVWKLVNQAFYGALESAFASEKPITLKPHYFSLEARKKPQFNIKNRDAVSLAKVKSSENIELLLKKNIITQQDLEFLFVEDIFILSRKKIVDLIVSKKITLERALAMSDEERFRLRNELIYSVVDRGELPFEEVKNLTAAQVANAIKIVQFPRSYRIDVSDSFWILLSLGMRVEDILSVEHNQIVRVSQRSIHQLLKSGTLSVKQAVRLTEMQASILSNSNLCRLVRAKVLSLEKAEALSDLERKRLDSSVLCKLIARGKVKLEDALNPDCEGAIEKQRAEFVSDLMYIEDRSLRFGNFV